jgi:hypothetical protein
MAYLQARSGIARSGVTYAGLAYQTMRVYIDGVDRTQNVLLEGLSIVQQLNGHGTAHFLLRNYRPTVFNDIKVAYRTPSNWIFAGTILGARVVSPNRGAASQIWEISCGDYTWLMDRYALVNGHFASRGVNSAIAEILNDFTDGNFAIGRMPTFQLSAEGVQFTNARVSQVIDTFAELVGGWWYLWPHASKRRVHMFTEWIDGNPITVNNAALASTDLAEYDEDGKQLRTRTIVEGTPTPATASVAAGATMIPVANLAQFAAGGGTVQVGGQTVTYTGVTTTTDAQGNVIAQLTGVAGLEADVPVGSPVVPQGTAEDAAAQAALAAALGGGLSGIAVQYYADPSANQDATEDLAESDVETFSGASPLKSLAYLTDSRHAHPGKHAAFSLTAPNAYQMDVAGDFLIQQVTIAPYGSLQGTVPRLRRRVVAAQSNTELTDLLAESLRRQKAGS